MAARPPAAGPQRPSSRQRTRAARYRRPLTTRPSVQHRASPRPSRAAPSRWWDACECHTHTHHSPDPNLRGGLHQPQPQHQQQQQRQPQPKLQRQPQPSLSGIPPRPTTCPAPPWAGRAPSPSRRSTVAPSGCPPSTSTRPRLTSCPASRMAGAYTHTRDARTRPHPTTSTRPTATTAHASLRSSDAPSKARATTTHAQQSAQAARTRRCVLSHTPVLPRASGLPIAPRARLVFRPVDTAAYLLDAVGQTSATLLPDPDPNSNPSRGHGPNPGPDLT